MPNPPHQGPPSGGRLPPGRSDPNLIVHLPEVLADPAHVVAARDRVLFEESMEGVAVVSADGRFLRANRPFCDLLGYTLQELREMRQGLMQVTAPEDQETNWAQFLEVVGRHSDGYEMSKTLITKFREHVPVRVKVRPVLVEGEIVQLVKFVVAARLADDPSRAPDPDGLSIRVGARAMEYLRRNWLLVFTGSGTALGGVLYGVGATVQEFYQNRVEVRAQRQALEGLEKQAEGRAKQVEDLIRRNESLESELRAFRLEFRNTKETKR